MRIYISGPMANLSVKLRPTFENFVQATEILRANGYQVISPHETMVEDKIPGDTITWEDQLRADLITMLSAAEAVCVLDGWQYSENAQLEVFVARALSMPIGRLADWVTATQIDILPG